MGGGSQKCGRGSVGRVGFLRGWGGAGCKRWHWGQTVVGRHKACMLKCTPKPGCVTVWSRQD